MSSLQPDRPRSTSLGEYHGQGDSKSDLLEGHQKDPVATSTFRPADLSNLPGSQDKARELQRKVSHLTRTMHHNLKYVTQRGEEVANLEAKVGNLEIGSKAFSRTATTVDKKLWWQERNTTIIALGALGAVIALGIIYFFVKKLIFG